MKKMLMILSLSVSASLAFAADPDKTGAAQTGPAAPAAAPATSAPAASGDASAAQSLTAEIKVGTDVQNRDVVGEAANFGAEVEKVVAWTRITGAALPTEISHVWKRNGEEVSRVKLPVQSSSYRTYSRKSVAGLPGNWSVEVQDVNGATLGSKDFTVGAGDTAPAAPEAPAAPAAPAAK